MSKKITLEIPTELSSITLGQYQRYLKILDQNEGEEDSDFVNIKGIEIFCNVSLKEAYKVPVSQFKPITTHLSKLFKQKPPLQRDIKIIDVDGTELNLGFIPKLEDMTMGEFVDLDNYITDWQEMHKAMAVLYRPMKYKRKDKYIIHEYKASEEYHELMRDMPVSIAIGAMVFLSFRERTSEIFDGLFAKTSTDEGNSYASGFGRKWGWYQSIYSLAKGDVRKLDEVTKLPHQQCFIWLEFEKEKNELERRMLKIK